MKKTAFLIALVYTCFACTTSPKKETLTDALVDTTEVVAEKESESEEGPVIYLEGLYATSTQMPEQEYAIENLFDNDPDNHWATMKGAGPDEGFMLYFNEEVYVSELTLKTLQNSNFATVNHVTLYINGLENDYRSVAGPIKIKKKIKSLYIKVRDTERSTNVTGADETFFIAQFDSDSKVGVSSIVLTNEDGVAYKIVPPKKIQGEVKATSTLKPEISYHPIQLFDSRKEFVWAEGAVGNGENEVLTFTFETEVGMDGLMIWNGFQRSEKHFKSNARVKSFEFEAGGEVSTYLLKDSQEPQYVKFTKTLKGKEFKLTIKESYKGASYPDLVISEIKFIDGKQPFTIKTLQREQNKKDLQKKAQGTVLAKYLDRRIKNSTEDFEVSYSDKSLILRSDYTFVLYENISEDKGSSSEQKSLLADGNWELLELSEDKAKIRIFGKFVDLSTTIEYYKGNSSSETTRIFQDFVTIDKETIKGEKFLSLFRSTLPDTN